MTPSHGNRKSAWRGRRSTIGTSVEGRPIEAISFGRSAPAVLVLGGTHGDEPKSVYVARSLVELLSTPGGPPCPARTVIVPLVNPDGYERRRRRNAHGVDLNRNFPTRDWAESAHRSRYHGGPAPASEPETQALIHLIERLRPDRITSIHSISDGQFCLNTNGPARTWANRMRKANGYRVTGTIGYPTPGSFGTWAGIERRIPTITLELPSHHSRERCWRDNRDALLRFIGLVP